jgi:hypothetical protein
MQAAVHTAEALTAAKKANAHDDAFTLADTLILPQTFGCACADKLK